MIIEAIETEQLEKIAKKVEECFPDIFSFDTYYKYLRCGIFELRIIALMTEESDMTSCAVLRIERNFKNQLIMIVDFMWIDPHYPNLFKEYLEYASMIVKEKGIKKIIIITSRNEKAFERKYGKYGFHKTYTTFEKVID